MVTGAKKFGHLQSDVRGCGFFRDEERQTITGSKLYSFFIL